MCGIVGYIGTKNPKEVLINSLKNLEYRGYDSSGIALKNDQETQIIKSAGKIINLENKLKSDKLIEANIGIAHTRWATHGKANEINAHPHCVGKVTLVHNGIIENANTIRKELIESGIVFSSETDTEVVAALLNKYYDGDAVEAINKTIKRLEGSYALGILFDDTNELYAVRKDSPLIIGIGEEEYFIASDITAIINYTNNYILLDDNEIATLSKDNIEIIKDKTIINKEILTTDVKTEENDKCGYDHYMLKEIMEEPTLLENLLQKYTTDFSLLPDLSDYEEIHIVACGSALYAGMIGKFLLEEKANIKVICETASEYRYKNTIYDRKTLVILISQSGETADTIASMRKVNKKSIDTLAIVNVKTSTIARESKFKLFIEAGSEIAVATTKAYLLQVAILSLLSYKAIINKASFANSTLLNEIKILPALLKEILLKREIYQKIAQDIYTHEHVFFIGRKIDYAIALEGSLKLKEISYIHSEAYQAGELKHGTISLINDNIPVIAIISDSTIKEKTLSNIEEIKSRGAKIILISNEEITGYDLTITIPKISDFLQPLLITPCLQLIAYEVAKLRECDIDKPRNLAKSVTVE